jgi:alkylated DNA repair dioxygenase AlkB
MGLAKRECADPRSWPDAEVLFLPAFFSRPESDALFQALRDSTPWKQETITLYGKTVPLPRLTAWHGEQGKTYSYSGISADAVPWTPALLTIKERIEAASGVIFNSVLLNLYRNGRDSVSWHSDDEPELGTNPVIGSVSFGETRAFQFRHKKERHLRRQLELAHGSYLLMRGPTQHCWQHQVPKTRGPCGPRINLTFRVIC